MIDFRSILNLAQEMAGDSAARIKENVKENAQDGVDSQMVVDAVTAVGTLFAGIATEVVANLPKPPGFSVGSLDAEARKVIDKEIDVIVGRLGLVQEDELAALRKRVVELEKLVGVKPVTTPAKTMPAKTSSAKNTSGTKPAAKNTAANKSTAKKPAAKKAPAKKTSASKTN